MIDSNDFAEALCSESSYEYMERFISKDNRKHVPKGDLEDRFVNVKEWNESKLARDIEKTVQLLPVGQEVSVKDLKLGLRNYGLDDDEATKVIREVGTNDKRIKARHNSYARSKTIDDILLRRVDNY